MKLKMMIALLAGCFSFLTGCAIAPKSYIGNYIVVSDPTAREKVNLLATTLSRSLSREIAPLDEDTGGIAVLLKDNRAVEPDHAISVLITYRYPFKNYSITLRRGKPPEEDEEMRLLRRKLESILDEAGVKWSFKFTNWSYAG